MPGDLLFDRCLETRWVVRSSFGCVQRYRQALQYYRHVCSIADAEFIYQMSALSRLVNRRSNICSTSPTRIFGVITVGKVGTVT